MVEEVNKGGLKGRKRKRKMVDEFSEDEDWKGKKEEKRKIKKKGNWGKGSEHWGLRRKRKKVKMEWVYWKRDEGKNNGGRCVVGKKERERWISFQIPTLKKWLYVAIDLIIVSNLNLYWQYSALFDHMNHFLIINDSIGENHINTPLFQSHRSVKFYKM